MTALRGPPRAAWMLALLACGLAAAAAADEAPVQMDWVSMLSDMVDGDMSDGSLDSFFGNLPLGDDGMADIFGSLHELLAGMGDAPAAPGPTTGQPTTSSAEPTTPPAGPTPSAAPSADLSAEAASQLFSSLFEGASSPFAAFFSGGGSAGSSGGSSASQLLPSFLGRAAGSSSPPPGSAAARGFLLPGAGSSLGSLLGLGGGVESLVSPDNPLAALLQPFNALRASHAELMQRLQAALQQADSLFDAPNLDDLFGGFEVGSFLQSLGQEDRSLINHTLSAARELEQRYCTPSYATGGGKVPTNCEGGNVTLSISGGHCVFNKDKTVTCKKPRVLLLKHPSRCTLHHHEPVTVVGKECKVTKDYGERKEGYLKPPKNSTHQLPGLRDVDLPQLHDLHAALGGSPLLHHHNITLQGGGSSSLPARLADRLSGLRHAISDRLSALRQRLSHAVPYWDWS